MPYLSFLNLYMKRRRTFGNLGTTIPQSDEETRSLQLTNEENLNLSLNLVTDEEMNLDNDLQHHEFLIPSKIIIYSKLNQL